MTIMQKQHFVQKKTYLQLYSFLFNKQLHLVNVCIQIHGGVRGCKDIL